jgi:hypothetical protein
MNAVHGPRRPLLLVLKALVLFAVPAAVSWAQTPEPAAWQPEGTQRILAVTATGERLELGRVHFGPAAAAGATLSGSANGSPDGPAIAYRIEWHTGPSGPFKDHFLSMREFKCVDGGTELSCQVPYPHANPQTVSRAPSPLRWVWLEHSLLFFFKRPADYGAKLWNGVYHELHVGPKGLQSRPRAVDLNLIAAPPTRAGTAPEAAPYQRAQRDDMPADARWLRSLHIEP